MKNAEVAGLAEPTIVVGATKRASRFELLNRSSLMILSVKPQDRLGNKLLAALPGEEYERILPDLEQTSFSFGDSVYESNERLNYAYFPTTSVVSMVYTMRDGVSAEMGMVGNEGLIGVALFMGGETGPNRAIVRHAGGAVRMKASAFREEFMRGASFQQLLLCYTHALLTHISQKAVCNGLHSIFLSTRSTI
jgi:hypothetical protein